MNLVYHNCDNLDTMSKYGLFPIPGEARFEWIYSVEMKKGVKITKWHRLVRMKLREELRLRAESMIAEFEASLEATLKRAEENRQSNDEQIAKILDYPALVFAQLPVWAKGLSAEN
jgi:hypothetical protein